MSSTRSTIEAIQGEAIYLAAAQILANDIDEGPEVAFQCAAHQWYFDNVNDEHVEDICDVFNCTPIEIVERAMSMTVWLDEGFILRFAGQIPDEWAVLESV